MARKKRIRGNDEMLRFAFRIIRACSFRIVRDGDVDALPDLVALGSVIDGATAAVVADLRGTYSDPEIADRLGVTRQAVGKRWPRRAL